MPALRNARLEQLLGGQINDNLTYGQIKALIPNVGEAPDLDFKRDLYDTKDSGRKSMCSDVAALANANGGVLILGMDEDSQGRAHTDTGVSIADSEKSRIWQTVLDVVRPKPQFGVIAVEDPDRPGTGFLIIWVAPSADPPHALVMPNKSLLYPRRIGTRTVHLSETEVAEGYRARFAGLADRLGHAKQIEKDFAPSIDPSRVFVVVTLVPDIPGAFSIDTATFRAFEQSILTRRPLAFGIPVVRGFTRATVRHRRLVGVSSWQPGKPYQGAACELHHNGNGVYAAEVESHARDLSDTPSLVDSQQLVLNIGAALRHLALHARDRTSAGGMANLRATIIGGPRPGLALVSNLSYQNEQVGTHVATAQPEADALADIDELCEAKAGHVTATYRLASGLFQEFGRPEAPLLTPSGDIRLPYWGRDEQRMISAWAAESGVGTVATEIN
ncbi:hypothetical protein HDA40_005475 [Hamadaea flava]|uniref:Helix-turn-helix domain-containing protein n=1 Tax=Hamadaea flava TaxID=1742688 RepID=A0ABV8LXA7_9ACTN|nr:ATP-binding protein [Hamadaea flava]MCP2326968.1 hypothetical protein [Hamadaea flava]